jgi:hypothetical protein
VYMQSRREGRGVKEGRFSCGLQMPVQSLMARTNVEFDPMLLVKVRPAPVDYTGPVAQIEVVRVRGRVPGRG